MKSFSVKTKGWTDIIDVTDDVQNFVDESGKKTGVVSLFAVGSTVALTTIENDPNLYEDLKEVLEKLTPYKKDWKHHKTWGDDNGAAHLRASLFGPSLTVPFEDGSLKLGTWQKIVLIDFDTRARTRDVIVSIL
ncbi:YjbQ family protein [Candidatus Roizmanbacteria bacterium]|nr:YjbQ family protein [Candidatus Roizmanbacteria bacterium]